MMTISERVKSQVMVCIEALRVWWTGADPEPEMPDFDACRSLEALRQKSTNYVNRCVRWQKREHQRIDREVSGEKGWIARHRVWAVLIAAAVTMWLIYAASGWFGASQCCAGYFKASDYFDLMKSPVGVLLVASPVAFVIWVIRDANAREQIESQRADTNLKNFQRVMDLASGSQFKDPQEMLNYRSSRALQHNQDKTAEECLQIASIYTLMSFIKGEYGSTFLQPAFNLLLELWGSLGHAAAWHQHEQVDERNNTVKVGGGWNTPSRHFLSTLTPLEKAVHSALFCGAGRIFMDHRIDTRRMDIVAVKGVSEAFRLVGANLCETNWSMGHFHASNFSGADLSHTTFSSCHCPDSIWIGAFFKASHIGRSAYRAKFVNANFSQTTAGGADFQGADFRGATFSDADFMQASFVDADLRGVSLCEQTVLTGARINRNTQFGDLGAKPDDPSATRERKRWLARGAVWDETPDNSP